MNKTSHVEIDQPKYGWSSIRIQDSTDGTSFTGSLSYIENILTMFLDAFITYLTTKTPVAIEFDEEGTNFTIIILPDSIRVISDREITKVDTFYICPTRFIEDVCEAFKQNLDDWIRFPYLDETDEEQFMQDKTVILNKLQTIKTHNKE